MVTDPDADFIRSDDATDRGDMDRTETPGAWRVLREGGDSAREILAFDWSATPLGPLASWPAALRCAVAMILGCPQPMYVAWGPDLRFLFNDAYRPVLGKRLGGAMGSRFSDLWRDVWANVAEAAGDALAGRGTLFQDLPLTMTRNGYPEDTWWTFSFSPLYDDAGEVGGLLCVTSETTARVLAERGRAVSDERLAMAMAVGDGVGLWDWDVATDRITSDRHFATLYGVDPEIAAAGAPLADYFRNVHPDDLDALTAAIGHAIELGRPFSMEYRLVQPGGGVRWVAAQGRYQPAPDGGPGRFPGVSFDVTHRKESDAALRAAKEERDFVVALTERQRAIGDPDEIMRATGEALGRRLGVNRVGFYRMTGPRSVLYGPSWTDGALEPLIGERPADSFGARVEELRRSGAPIVFSDSHVDPEGMLAAFRRNGVRAAIGAPLLRDGDRTAGMFVNHSEPRTWSEAEVALVREVAELTWLSVERAEAVVRLNERLERQVDQLALTAYELLDEREGRLAAERHLRQLQKMEAVGQLTGGIAHDFNNMLAVVMGGLDLLQRRLARGDADVGKYVEAAMDGATRAAALTQRLLAFSRRQPLAPEPIDANRLVEGMAELMSRTLGETIRVEARLAPALWTAKADPSELENVLLNLAVNARDAMPGGGWLTIETGNAEIGLREARASDIEPGAYVAISVADSGSGMTPETAARAFEPFFTTKGVGKGTGLGLSQAYGFARQSGGHVSLRSEVGQGTTVRLLLPRSETGESARAKAPAEPLRGGSPEEVVLVVEDEERVRAYSVEALRELGYAVIAAPNGPAALEIVASGQPVSLLFTDIVMPGMNGRELARRARAVLPRLKVLYTTGYDREAVADDGAPDASEVLPKPFSLDQLTAKVRAALDG